MESGAGRRWLGGSELLRLSSWWRWASVPGSAPLCAAPAPAPQGLPTSGLLCPRPGPVPRTLRQQCSPPGQQLHATTVNPSACPAPSCSSVCLSSPLASWLLLPSFPKSSDQFEASKLLLNIFFPACLSPPQYSPGGYGDRAPPLTLTFSSTQPHAVHTETRHGSCTWSQIHKHMDPPHPGCAATCV